MNNLVKWDKTFPQNYKVEHKKSIFLYPFRHDLYRPKGVSGELPAIAVCGPFGAGELPQTYGCGFFWAHPKF